MSKSKGAMRLAATEPSGHAVEAMRLSNGFASSVITSKMRKKAPTRLGGSRQSTKRVGVKTSLCFSTDGRTAAKHKALNLAHAQSKVT